MLQKNKPPRARENVVGSARDSASAVVAVVAVLRAGATEKVVGLCCEVRSTPRRFVDGRQTDIAFRGSKDTRYLVGLLLQALSEHVGTNQAFSRIDQGLGAMDGSSTQRSLLRHASRDNCIRQERGKTTCSHRSDSHRLGSLMT